MEVLALPARDGTKMYVPEGDGWVGCEPNRLLLMPLPFIFLYYCYLVWHESEADNVDVSRITVPKFLGFALFSSVSRAGNGVFRSKTADPNIVVDGLGFYIPYMTVFPAALLIYASSR